MYVRIHVKYPLFLSDFNETLIFSTDFSKNTQISDFMIIRPLGPELFHADRQTRRTNSPLSQFCERTWKRWMAKYS